MIRFVNLTNRASHNLERFTEQCLVDGEFGQEPDAVGVQTSAEQDHAALEAAFDDLRHDFHPGFFLYLIVNKLEAHHATNAAHVAKNWYLELHGFKDFAHDAFNSGGAVDGFLAGEDFDCLERGNAGERVAAVSAARAANMWRIEDFGTSGDRRNWQSRPERFGADDHVRHDARVFNRIHFARASRTRLNLVGDHHRTRFVADFTDFLEELFRHGNEAALADDGFDHDGSQRRTVNVGDQGILEIPATPLEVIFLTHAFWGAVKVWHGQAVDFWGEGSETFFEQAVLAGHRHRQVAAPVVRTLKDDDARPTRKTPRKFDGIFDGFRAAV